mgnify:FL=1
MADRLWFDLADMTFIAVSVDILSFAFSTVNASTLLDVVQLLTEVADIFSEILSDFNVTSKLDEGVVPVKLAFNSCTVSALAPW